MSRERPKQLGLYGGVDPRVLIAELARRLRTIAGRNFDGLALPERSKLRSDLYDVADDLEEL